MSIIIKPFHHQLQNQVIDLISTIQQQEFKINISPEDQPDLKDIVNFYQVKKGNFWLAIDDNQVIGTVALLDIDNNQAALRKMFVDKRYRGKTYGTAKILLNTLLHWSKAQEVKEIYLGTTPQFVAAHRFYEKNHFQEISITQLPDNFPIMAVDKKFYQYYI